MPPRGGGGRGGREGAGLNFAGAQVPATCTLRSVTRHPLQPMSDLPPICHVVAGPNGSGKSTFALRYLPRWAGEVEYVNPDLIAQGASPP